MRNNGIEKRIEKIEKRTNFGKGIGAVCVRYVAPGHINRPVSGWSFGPWDKRVQVLREAGETDEELIYRSIALAREHAPGSVPSLTSITESCRDAAGLT